MATLLPPEFEMEDVCANCRWYAFDLEWPERVKLLGKTADSPMLESDKRPTNRRCTKGYHKVDYCCDTSEWMQSIIKDVDTIG